MMNPTQIQSTAIHECGHATVAAHLGAPVSLIALWGLGGVVEYLSDDTTPLDNVAIVTAGHAAITLSDPALTFDGFADGTDRRCMADFLDAQSWLNRLPAPSTGKRRRSLVRDQWERSRSILRPRWSGVIALANALLAAYDTPMQHGEIAGRELTHLLAFAA